MTANPCSTIVGGKPCNGSNGSGGGSIQEITSDDGSIIVDNPNGPIVDLSFAGSGGSGGFVQEIETNAIVDIAGGVWADIGTLSLALGAFDWFLSFSAASSHNLGSVFRVRLAADGVEIPGTVRQLRLIPSLALLTDVEDLGIQLVYTVPAGIETITAQVIRDAGVGPFNVVDRVLSALLLGGAPPP
jgi:hypothetical protein